MRAQWRRWKSNIMVGVLVVCAVLSVLPLLLILGTLIVKGAGSINPDFFTRMRGQGPWADLLRTRFEIACKRYNMPNAKFRLRRDLFEPPQGDQLRLF